MLAEGVRLRDRYRLVRLLGRGGMASVWQARDERLDRDVAIKALSDTIASDQEFLARFRREARIAAGLSHPNLIGIYDYAEGEERPYLVMEYVAGPNLAERLRQAPVDCERLARELLSALAHIHAAGILHRDVKPQNVLLDADGNAKLIDFGIALPDDATALTRTGNVLGTARYIAPEVMAGGPASERSDLYACGVVLRDCLAASSAGDLLRPLADRLAADDPRERPVSAAAAAAQLPLASGGGEQPTQRFETQAGQTPTPVPPPPSGRARRRRRDWWRPAAALAAVAVLGAAFLLAYGDGDGDPEQRADRGAAAGESDAGASQGREAGDDAGVVAEPSGDDPARGAALNEEGFELVQAGSYEEAIPLLEAAVRAFPAGTEDLDYAYALFNLGNALRLAGRPEEAIPLLERRLAIPNQRAVVRRELEAARRDAAE